ncbi:hypothetical protein OPS25_02285 [Alteromonas ponticola]|uniref:Uncharacterized protein n=1 Tax=Alteromonas aquimaris TaxID=2998417 RepID=A0ABT3P3J7_9ALTE|nr:hypothetical protein [Alteromonas aquimaris]MCW8107333.1 hypothetical protein [Alteromonas aquimaris]
MSHKKQLITAFFLTVSTFSTTATESSEIVNSYPACDYQIIDTIQVNTTFQAVTNDEFVEKYNHAIEHLLPKLVDAGTKIKAPYLAITEKKLRTTSGRQIVYLYADAIAKCELSSEKKVKFAPYNKFAQRQVASSIATTTIESSFTFDTSPKTQLKPKLTDNVSVGLSTGLYGIPLGSTEKDVISHFGTPSFEKMLADDRRLISYGREHWLTFHAGKLHKVEFDNPEITWTLKNFIPVDDRFKNRDWYISETVYKGAEIMASDLPELVYGAQIVTLNYVSKRRIIDKTSSSILLSKLPASS